MRIEQSYSTKNFHKISIAPMMDCTDKHFRMIMRKISLKVLLYTEMIVAQSLIYTNQKKSFLISMKMNILYQSNWGEIIHKFLRRPQKWLKIGAMTKSTLM